MAKTKKRKQKKSSQKPQESKRYGGYGGYGYQGANSTRLTSDWVDTGATADFLVASSGDKLRNRARSLDRENDYVVSAVNKLCIKTLGDCAPIFQSRIKKLRSGEGRPELNEILNDRIEAEFKLWSSDRNSIDAGRRWNLTQILDLCVRTLAVDGEVFLRKLSLKRGRSPVKFALEMIEADNLADTYQGDRHGNPIVNGIEYDEWGAPIAYWFYPYSPNDFLYGKHRNFHGTDATHPIRYPAKEIIHLYSPRRITQGRGVSWLSATLNRLRDLLGYEQAVLIGARMRAAVMGFIQTPEGEEAYGVEVDPNAPRQYSFEPGTIQVLNEGEEFNLADAKDPGPNLEGFGRYMLRAFAANLGISYSSVSGDYSQANYSSERAAKLDENRGIARLQNHIKSVVLCDIADTFLDRATIQGVIKVAPGLATPDYLCQYDWRLAGFDFIDPQKDAQAYELQLKNGMTSLRRVLSAKGIDLHELLEERQYEQQLFEEYGLKVAYLEESGGGAEIPQIDEEAPVAEGLTQVRGALVSQSKNLDAVTRGLQSAIRTINLLHSEIQDLKQSQASVTTLAAQEVIRESLVPNDWNIAFGMEAVRDFSGIRKKKCTKKPCGNSCIAMSKACLKDLSPEQRKLAIKARDAMKKGQIENAVDISESENSPSQDNGEKSREKLEKLLASEYTDKGIKGFKDNAENPPFWQDVMAVNNYTSSEYREINESLRSGGKTTQVQSLTIERTDAALEVLPKFEGVVYRGTNLTQDLIDSYAVGETIQENAYVSTSKNKKKAFNGNAKFVIQSRSGVDVSNYSNYKKEEEVLIPRGKKFKVTRKRKQGRSILIYMEELADG